MRRWFLSLGALALATLPLSASPTAGDWLADFDQAVEVAKRENKDLLVDFTGSDWCTWCIRLDREVFSHQEFLTPAKQKFVLVKLDFPRAEEIQAKVPNPKRNRELQAKYGVRGFPTILLMTAQGQVYGKTGYRQGGPASYVEHLDQMVQESRQQLARIGEQLETFKTAKGAARIAAAEKLLAELKSQGSDSPFARMIAEPLAGLLQEDVAVELKRGVLRALIGIGQVDAGTVDQARTLDPKNAEGLYQEAVLGLLQSVGSESELPAAVRAIEDLLATGGVKDQEAELQLRLTAADWLHRFLGKPEEAKAHARRALEIAPAKEEAMIEYLRSILNAQ